MDALTKAEPILGSKWLTYGQDGVFVKGYYALTHLCKKIRKNFRDIMILDQGKPFMTAERDGFWCLSTLKQEEGLSHDNDYHNVFYQS